jgi:hypothetical protein
MGGQVSQFFIAYREANLWVTSYNIENLFMIYGWGLIMTCAVRDLCLLGCLCNVCAGKTRLDHHSDDLKI